MERIYTCSCLLEQMIGMTYHKIEDLVDTMEIFSLTNEHIIFAFQEKCLYLFCTDLALFARRFCRSDFCCLRRNDIDDLSCLQNIEIGSNLCYNCLYVFSEILRKILIEKK